jgi:tetratricopeptide (TPR) repeat protein
MSLFKKDTGKHPREDPQKYVVAKQYKKAIELYRVELKTEADDPSLHLRLGDTLALDGQKPEAISCYKKAAAIYAEQGFLLKAVGVNKKIVRLDPSQEDVHNQLSKLYEEKGLLASSPAPRLAATAAQPPFTPAPVARAAQAAVPRPRPHVEETMADISVDAIADALSDMPESSPDDNPMVLDLDAALEAPDAAGAAQEQFTYQKTPLFSDFTAVEFVDVVKQMHHEAYLGGSVIVREGDPGDAMFVITSGAVKVVTKAQGKDLQLAVLKEGDFFGEGSLITGKPRTATVIAEEESELLKLDRSGFDQVVSRYPRVKEVMVSFYKARAEATVKSILKSARK